MDIYKILILLVKIKIILMNWRKFHGVHAFKVVFEDKKLKFVQIRLKACTN
jgi:hypothetical protein